MIVFTVALLGFALVELIRWLLEPAKVGRKTLAALVTAAICGSLAALAGQGAVVAVLVLGLGSFLSTAAWLWLSRRQGSLPALALMFGVLVGAFALSGSFGASSGPLESWYEDLPFPFVHHASLDQSLVAVAATLFLLAASNQVVRLVLAAAGTPVTRGETALKGGRVIGPMERLFVMAMVVFGAATAAAALIAAKGFLRLPEIRSEAEQGDGRADHVTEYFLIGTFASLLLAAVLGGTIRAAG